MASANFAPIFDLLSAVVALLVSYYAFKNNKIVGNSLLRYIGLGFLLLSFSLFLNAGTEVLVRMSSVDAVRVRGLELVAYLVDTALEFTAYLVFAWGYVLSSLRRSDGSSQVSSTSGSTAGAGSVLATTGLKSVVLATFVFTVYLISQLAIVILLLFIVYHGIVIFRRGKSNVALTVLFGFSLLFAAHIALFTAAIYTSGTLLLIGDTVEFCGFLALLFFLYWSGRAVK